IPLALLASIEPRGFDWQVPGLRDELVTAMLKALPKAMRRHVVPAADWAAKFAEELTNEGPESANGLPERSLAEALARLVQRQANRPVTPADFDLERVPGHLTMNFRAVDHRGRVAGNDRDLETLKKKLSSRARDSVAQQIGRATPAQKVAEASGQAPRGIEQKGLDRKSTRLNSSHVKISYAVFCLKKK